MAELNLNDLKKEYSINIVIDELLTEEFTLKNLSNYGVTARSLQYWQEKGLLPSKKRKNDENHKFNFVEFVWLGIICELSQFRFPIAKIKKVKEKLFEEKSLIEFFGYKNGDDPHEILFKVLPQLKKLNRKFDVEKILEMFDKLKMRQKLPLLSLSVLGFILERMNSKVLIFSNGQTEILPTDDSPGVIESLKVIEDKSYLSIPISKIMSQFVNDNKNNEFSLRYHLLTDTELKILTLVKLNKFDSLKVLFKHGEPFILEATENIKVSKDARISDILLRKGYQSIEIKSEEGTIVYAPKTTKYLL